MSKVPRRRYDNSAPSPRKPSQVRAVPESARLVHSRGRRRRPGPRLGRRALVPALGAGSTQPSRARPRRRGCGLPGQPGRCCGRRVSRAVPRVFNTSSAGPPVRP
jgi:hypothetical protein